MGRTRKEGFARHAVKLLWEYRGRVLLREVASRAVV
jgi:hypothetical protein